MTYKVTTYGKVIRTMEFEDLYEMIREVYYLLETALEKGWILAVHVSKS